MSTSDFDSLVSLVAELDFADTSLNHATIQQGRLIERAAKYYTTKMRARMEAENAFEERKSALGLKFRREDWVAKKDLKPRPKEMTETQLSELVMLQKSVRDLKRTLDKAKVEEEYGRLLLKAFEWRGMSCQILGKTLDEEARGDLRILMQAKAKKKLLATVREKYAAEE